jgi:hypothetical protein
MKGTDNGTDIATDRGTDMGAEGRWLTYGELADLRRIDRHSAVKLVTRHHWRKQRDNHGKLRILVPPEWDKGTDRGTDIGTDMGAMGTDIATDTVADINARFEVALAALQQQQDHERTTWRDDRTRLLAEIDGFRTQVDHERERANRAEQGRDGERARADALRDRLAAAEDAAKQARAKAQGQQAEAEARRSAGLLTRLRAAWRGE